MAFGWLRKSQDLQPGWSEVWLLRLLSLASCGVASKVFYMRYFGKSFGSESIDTYLISFTMGIGVFIGLRYLIDIVFDFKNHRILSFVLIVCCGLVFVVEFNMGNDAMDSSLHSDFNTQLQLEYNKIDQSPELLNYLSSIKSLESKLKNLASEDSLLEALGNKKRYRTETKYYNEEKSKKDSLYSAIRAKRRDEAKSRLTPVFGVQKSDDFLSKYPSAIVSLVTLILLSATRYCEEKYGFIRKRMVNLQSSDGSKTVVKYSKESERIDRNRVDLTVESTGNIQLDMLEKKILEIVLSHPDISYTQLSKLVDAPRSTCLNKRRSLEAKGCLKPVVNGVQIAKAEVLN